ncbi:MAG: CpaF family protein, partial [Bacteroidota bacterium]
MFLRSKLKPDIEEKPEVVEVIQAEPEPKAQRFVDPFREIKGKAHRILVESMRQQGLDDASSPEEIREAIRRVLDEVLSETARIVNRAERDRLIEEIYHDMRGHGPLEVLLNDDNVSEIMVNNPGQVYIERQGKILLSEVTFYDEKHLLRIIDRIVSRVGRRIDESSPMCDARLPDGSRVNAIIPPLAIDGPALTIRKFKKDPLKIRDLIEFNSISAPMVDFLRGCVEAKLNVLISGGTGSGKTTLLNVLSSFIPDRERLITIEDAAELQLQQEHVIRLETRPNNTKGVGGINQAELLKN